MAPKKKASKKVTFSEENNTVAVIPPDGIPIEVAPKEPKKEDPLEDLQKKDDVFDSLTHVVVQLPISAEHVENLLSQDDMCNPLEYNPRLPEPSAYAPVNFFSSKNDEFFNEMDACDQVPAGITDNRNHKNATSMDQPCYAAPHKKANCFWCCHHVEHHQFGMPTRYDPVHNSFAFFGTFCSPECCSAYNFSVHMGSDRAWDVQSWIQIMARNYGIEGIIRPAPSRYTLQMFDGPLTIEEFRRMHKGISRTVMVNIPPLVSMKPQIETMNTSFFSVENTKDTTTETTKKSPLRRKIAATEPKKTLESKMNLSCTSLAGIIETA